MTQTTDNSIFVVTQITVWIHEYFKGVFDEHLHNKLSDCLANSRVGLLADFSFRYPASVKPYRFRDTERRNCVLTIE